MTSCPWRGGPTWPGQREGREPAQEHAITARQPRHPVRCCVLSALQRGRWSPPKGTDSPPRPPHELPRPTEAPSHLDRAARHHLPALGGLCLSLACHSPPPPHLSSCLRVCAPSQGPQWVRVPRPWLAVWTLLLLLPLDVQQHEYSYFLFKTNLDFSLSEGLLIAKKRLRQEMIDRPRWPLLKNKLAIGSATDKGEHRLVIGGLFGNATSICLPLANTCQTSGDGELACLIVTLFRKSLKWNVSRNKKTFTLQMPFSLAGELCLWTKTLVCNKEVPPQTEQEARKKGLARPTAWACAGR